MSNQKDPSDLGPVIPGDPNTAPALPRVDRAAPIRTSEPANELQGIPDDEPVDWRKVAAEENLFEQSGGAADQEFEEALMQEMQTFSPTAWLGRWIGVWPLLVLICCAILLLALSQILAVFSQIQGLPEPAYYGVLALVVLLLAGMVWSVVRLAMVFVRVRTTPRVHVTALQKLSARAELREQANSRLDEARKTLQEFLKTYPLSEESDAGLLLGKCLSQEDWATVRRNARALLSEEYGTTADWLKALDHQFLTYLDEAARKRIKQYANRVALKTAALPTKLDAPVVLLNAYLMARDLCVIYNLRTTGTGSAMVLSHILLNMFAASQIYDWSESTMDLFFGAGTAAGIGKAVSARMAEGALNRLLFMRLGSAMARHLRPIWPPQRASS